jgi:hemolysin activation/secretion protein
VTTSTRNRGAFPSDASRPPGRLATTLAFALAAWLAPAAGWAAEASAAAPRRSLDILEFRVEGATVLSPEQVDAALLPFVGLARPLADVEAARAALEKAYADAGFHSVAVAIPQQTVRNGVVTLVVTEPRIGRLRVQGARWFLPSEIRTLAPSMAEGEVPNYQGMIRDVAALNLLPDRRVTPAIRQGRTPGTLDVDLNVQDRIPLHASVELNDRHGRDTTPLRSSAWVRYDNLWQLAHTLSVGVQLAPQRLDDGRVYSISYTARFPEVPWLAATGSWFEQGSDLSTLGGVNVVGRGRVIGLRLQATLPGETSFFHAVSAGFDAKSYRERLELGSSTLSSPVTYVPIVAQYAAAWTLERSQTQVVTSVAANVRALSSGPERFDAKRYQASADFVVGRAEVARTDRLPLDLQTEARISGQYSPDPLVGSEQVGAGGASTVRGYLESEAVGDFGGYASLQLSSPSLAPLLGRRFLDEWRFHLFADGGWVGIHHALPEQRREQTLSSVGAGTALSLAWHVSGGLDVGLPLRSTATSGWLSPRVHFRVAAEF